MNSAIVAASDQMARSDCSLAVFHCRKHLFTVIVYAGLVNRIGWHRRAQESGVK